MLVHKFVTGKSGYLSFAYLLIDFILISNFRLGADKPLTTVIEMRNEGVRLEQDSNVHAHQDGQLAPPYSVSLVHSDSNQDQMYNHSTSFGEADMRDPMSPPSYDEATKNLPQSAASPLYLDDPPPYQPVRRLSS